MGSLLNDLDVDGVGKDIFTGHNVIVDALVNQLAIQRNLAPLPILQNSNDAENAPSKIAKVFSWPQTERGNDRSGYFKVKGIFLRQ